jgi:hypothetical protein
MAMRHAKTPAPSGPELTAAPSAPASYRASGGRFGSVGDVLLHLQRQYGNQYVQQVIGRAREAEPLVQAKLVLGPPGDRYEREADRVAAAVAGREASKQPPGAGGGAVETPVAQALQQARRGGQPLPAPLRLSMERALGADFGGVRLHTGARSDQLNRSLQAAAFTSGQDIFFRRDAYSPSSQPGTALLAHELTHVVQQRSLRRNTIQRHFAPPASPYQKVTKPQNPLGLTQKAQHQSKTAGWAISKNAVAAQEMLVTGGARPGHKVTRFTALLTPGHANLSAGIPTRLGFDPLGWPWVEANEVRSANRGALRYWIRFHLLNADLGGKGTKALHLVPTTKTANAQWDHNIERPMTDALTGANPTPVYYDVQLTYWGLGDAPASYVDATTGTDYRPNITLFPRSIQGNWQQFDRGRWLPQPSLTVPVDKPRGITGEDVDLATHQQLNRLAKLFHIDEGILGLLQRKARNTHFATYGDVRRVLEAWAMTADTTNKISERLQAIYESDGYLRTALAGGQSFKLKINNQRVPDDATPEAKMFGPAVRVRTHQDLGSYVSLTPPIFTGYERAQQGPAGAVEYFPQFEEFVWLLTTKGALYGDKLDALQRQWDTFKSANGTLPPMRDTHLVPDQDEIRTVLQRKTQTQVVQSVRGTFAQRITAATGPATATAAANELADALSANYDQVMRSGFPNLTVEQANDVPKLALALLGEDPLRPLTAELNARLAAAPDMVGLNIARAFPYHPFTTPLTVPLGAEMQRRVAAEQQRLAAEQLAAQQLAAQQLAAQQLAAQQLAAQQPPPPAPQPVQAVPTGRHRIPTGRPTSPRRPQIGNPPIHRVEERTHPYNQSVIRALRVAVVSNRRYKTADHVTQTKMWRRMSEIEERWNSPKRIVGRSTLAEDVEHGLAHVFKGY